MPATSSYPPVRRDRRRIGLLVAFLLLLGSVLLGGCTGGSDDGAESGEASESPSRPPAEATERDSATEKAQAIRIDLAKMTPSIGATGPVRMSGTLTNVSDQDYTDLNVHPFIAYSPMTTADQLAAADRLSESVEAQGRIVSDGFTTIDRIEAGKRVRFSIRIPRKELDGGAISGASGVYLTGVNVLGTTREGREVAGRARTLIPKVDTDSAKRVTAGLVVPIRRGVVRTPQGRLDGLDGWQDDLAPGGRLRGLADIGRAADVPVTWLVDPAVPDAVSDLSHRNPARYLGPDPRAGSSGSDSDGSDSDSGSGGSDNADGSGGSGASDSDSAEDGSEGGGSAPDVNTPRGLDAVGQAAGRATGRPLPGDLGNDAAAWYADLTAAMPKADLLTLPYADVDVDAAATQGTGLLREAVSRSNQWGIAHHGRARAAIAPLEGGFAPEKLGRIDDSSLLIVTDDAVAGTPQAPADTGAWEVARTTEDKAEKQPVLSYSPQVAEGGPGPTAPRSVIQTRQRILAEAALRATTGADPQPMPVVLDPSWRPRGDPTEFTVGLDQKWLRFVPLEQLSDKPAALPRSNLTELAEPERPELPASSFAAARELRGLGERLEDLLADNNTVAQQTLGQALGAISSHARGDAETRTDQTRSASRVIRGQLDKVELDGPGGGVTQISETGKLAVTVTNGLDQPIEVRLRAQTDNTLQIRAPESIRVQPRSGQQILLEANTDRLGKHMVTLIATDSQGRQVGNDVEVVIEVNQLSRVIWLVLGAAALLFGVTIARRLSRRVRERRAKTVPTPTTPTTEPTGPTGPTQTTGEAEDPR